MFGDKSDLKVDIEGNADSSLAEHGSEGEWRKSEARHNWVGYG